MSQLTFPRPTFKRKTCSDDVNAKTHLTVELAGQFQPRGMDRCCIAGIDMHVLFKGTRTNAY